ncbi:hypothetical protein C4587_01235 [Candidatus Parcubacteria bacterium]|nr:MAG: hypothetical protein C4587_01235 [Candidatus Parcubacteria bacterium]
MLDIKRLITSFLVVSVVVSSLALIFSGARAGNGAKKVPEEESASAPKSPGFQVPPTAFVESVPDKRVGSAEERSGAVNAGQAPKNLTENLARAIAEELVRTNPSGPTEVDDKLGLLLPIHLEEKIGEQIAAASISPPDLVLDGARIRTQESFSKDDIARYATRVVELLATTFSGPAVESLSLEEAGPETFQRAHLLYAQAQEEMYALAAPTPFAGVHRSLLRFLELQKLATDQRKYVEDPLGAIAMIENHDSLVQARREEVEREIEAAKRALASLPPAHSADSIAESFLREMFGVPIAFAIPVEVTSDVSAPAIQTATASATNAATNKSNFFQKLFEWGRKFATEQLKPRLVHLLVEQTINWVQGGGKPQFITNWRAFLSDAANEAAGAAIAEIAPGLCRSFGPLVEISLQPVNLRRLGTVCTLDQVVGNIQDFYNDFQNGGWIAYGAALRPENNFFGSLIIASDIVLRESAEAEETARNEAVANRGFLSTKICVKEHEEDDIGYDPETGAYGYVVGKKTVCDEYQNTTPGGTIAHALDKATTVEFDRIIAADDLEPLIDGLINAAITRLVQAGTEGLSGLLNDSGRSRSASSACAGMTGNALAECQRALQDIDEVIEAANERVAPTSTAITSTSTDPCAGLVDPDLLNCRNVTGESFGF